jgi:hypothetical protein
VERVKAQPDGTSPMQLAQLILKLCCPHHTTSDPISPHDAQDNIGANYRLPGFKLNLDGDWIPG